MLILVFFFISSFFLCSGREVLIINPKVANDDIVAATDLLISGGFGGGGSKRDVSLEWQRPLDVDYNKGIRLILKHNHEVSFVTWHRKGDYFSSVCPEGKSKSVFIHQLSKHSSQNPFKKNAGLIQCVQFHPSKPIFFVAVSTLSFLFVLVLNLISPSLDSEDSEGVQPHAARAGEEAPELVQVDLEP